MEHYLVAKNRECGDGKKKLAGLKIGKIISTTLTVHLTSARKWSQPHTGEGELRGTLEHVNNMRKGCSLCPRTRTKWIDLEDARHACVHCSVHMCGSDLRYSGLKSFRFTILFISS